MRAIKMRKNVSNCSIITTILNCVQLHFSLPRGTVMEISNLVPSSSASVEVVFVGNVHDAFRVCKLSGTPRLYYQPTNQH